MLRQKSILIIWAVSQWVPPLAQLLEDNEIFHSPTLRRGVKWGRVLCRHATLWDNEIFLLSASSSRSGMKIGKINTRRARGEERWGYLARTISHLFPFFISHGSTKNALAVGKINYGLELVIPTGSVPWVKNVWPERSWGRLVLRNTNYSSTDSPPPIYIKLASWMVSKGPKIYVFKHCENALLQMFFTGMPSIYSRFILSKAHIINDYAC